MNRVLDARLQTAMALLSAFGKDGTPLELTRSVGVDDQWPTLEGLRTVAPRNAPVA